MQKCGGDFLSPVQVLYQAVLQRFNITVCTCICIHLSLSLYIYIYVCIYLYTHGLTLRASGLRLRYKTFSSISGCLPLPASVESQLPESLREEARSDLGKESGAPFLGVLTMRIIVYWVLLWGPQFMEIPICGPSLNG